MSETNSGQALLRCQAYNSYLTRHIVALIDMIDKGQGPPNMATLRELLAETIRRAKSAADKIEGVIADE